jgi:hypothetical protein
MVLEYYCQLWICGVIQSPFHAVVLDTDSLNRPLAAAQVLFDALRINESGNGAWGTQVPTISAIRPQSPENTQVSRLLAGEDIAQLPALHPVRAFFDTSALHQDIQQGLFAKPALSSTLSLEELTPDALHLPPAQTADAKGVVVGSFLGGTGAGLIAPLLDCMRAAKASQRTNLSLRAVLFGEYFPPNERIVSRDSLRSNKLMASRALEEAGTILLSFCVIGEEESQFLPYPRDPSSEKTEPPPWPASSRHPYWLGALAVDAFLREGSIQAVPVLSNREVAITEKGFAGTEWTITINGAQKRIKQAVGRASAIIEHEVLHRMARDPLAVNIWGQGLTTLLKTFWDVTKVNSGDALPVFLPEVGVAIKEAFENEETGLNMRLFPKSLQPDRAAQRALVEAPWPNPLFENFSEHLFRGKEDSERRAAATILTAALRGRAEA